MKTPKEQNPKMLMKESFKKWDFELKKEESNELFSKLISVKDKRVCIIEQSSFEDGSEECLLLIKVK
jgi:hypothetical protein